MHARYKHHRLGVTLVEVALVATIVVIAVTALMEFLANASSANRNLSKSPVAVAVCRAGHEWARLRDYTQLTNTFYPGGTYADFSPTNLLNASGIADGVTGANLAQGTEATRTYQGWTQRFSARKVSPISLTTTVPSDTVGSPLEVTVTALYNGAPVTSLTRVYFAD